MREVSRRVRLTGAALAAVTVLAGLAVLALPASGHSDPFIEPGYGATPNPVGQGQNTVLRAIVSCALPGCQPAWAEAYILPEMAGVFPGTGNHDDPNKNGLRMDPSDGLWGNSDTEVTSVTNDSGWLAQGPHDVYIRGQGCGGAPTCWSDWVTFVLVVDPPTTDTSAPEQLNPHFEPDNVISAGENSVTFAGTLDDTGDPGTATVAGAEYWYSGCGIPFIPGTPMTARDGAFDEEVEDAVYLLDVTGWPDGTYAFYLRGWDSLGNEATSCISAELYIQRTPTDLLPPVASGPGSVSPNQVAAGGGPVDITAAFDDTATGGSNVGGAEYFVDPDPLTGNPNPGPYVSDTGVSMLPADGFWDSSLETAAKWGVDVSAWLPGIYAIHLHARDQWGNWGDFGTAGEHSVGTLTIGNPVPLSPTGQRLAISGNNLVLTWTAPSPPSGLDHYAIYRGGSGVGCPVGSLLTTVPAGTTTYTHVGGAADASPWFYVVRSANAAGQEDANCVTAGKLPLALTAGVNEVSTPFVPTDPSPAGFFAPVSLAFSGVGAYAPGTGWTFYNSSGGGALAAITNGMGLRVAMTAAATLPVVGLVPTSVAIPVSAGWNFLGYGSLTPGTVPAAFDANGLSGVWTRALAHTADRYDPWKQYHAADASFRDLAALSPGQGFWLFANGGGIWTPPPT